MLRAEIASDCTLLPGIAKLTDVWPVLPQVKPRHLMLGDQLQGPVHYVTSFNCATLKKKPKTHGRFIYILQNDASCANISLAS